MKFHAVKDSDYERRRDGLIAHCEKVAYELTKHLPKDATTRSIYSRMFMDAMQDEAVRLHLTDGMTMDPLAALARQLKIQVTPSGTLAQGQLYKVTHGEEDALD